MKTRLLRRSAYSDAQNGVAEVHLTGANKIDEGVLSSAGVDRDPLVVPGTARFETAPCGTPRTHARCYAAAGDDTGHMRLLTGIGWLLARMGRPTSVRHSPATKNIGDDHFTADMLDHLGQAHAALGSSQEARATWKRALDLYRHQLRDTEARHVEQLLADLAWICVHSLGVISSSGQVLPKLHPHEELVADRPGLDVVDEHAEVTGQDLVPPQFTDLFPRALVPAGGEGMRLRRTEGQRGERLFREYVRVPVRVGAGTVVIDDPRAQHEVVVGRAHPCAGTSCPSSSARDRRSSMGRT